MRDHVAKCGRRAISGRRPLNRPAKFPIAKEQFEVLQIDFFEFVGEEFLHMQDAFTRFSVLRHTGTTKEKKKMESKASERLLETIVSGWISIFGVPRIIMGDMDARFTSHTFERFCAVNHMSFLATPAKKHTGIGSLERKHAVMARILHEMLTEEQSVKGELHSLEMLAGMVTMISNSQISNDDGHSAGHRMYGRSPRLPISTIDSVNFCELINDADPSGRAVNNKLGRLARIREMWLKNENIKVFRRITERNAPKTEKNRLFLGQSVYFWHDDKNDKYSRMKGPGLITAIYGPGQLLIGYHSHFYTVSIDRVTPTEKALELIGADGQLQIHTLGSKLPVHQLVDSRTLVYLMRYRDLVEMKKIPDAENLQLDDLSLVKEMEKNEKYRRLTSDLGGEEEFEMFFDAFKNSELKLMDADFKSTLENMKEILMSQTADSIRKRGNIEFRIMKALENEKESEQRVKYSKGKKQLQELLKRYNGRCGILIVNCPGKLKYVWNFVVPSYPG